MPIATSPNRGRNPAVNSTCIVRPLPTGEVVLAAGIAHISREIVCGIDAGVNVLFWAFQTAGAFSVTVRPEFLYQQFGAANVPQWERIDADFLIPAFPGNPVRRVFQHPARRFRATFTADIAGGASFRYYFATWAV